MNLQNPNVIKAAELALWLHKSPSQLLSLKINSTRAFHVDHAIIMGYLTLGEEESEEEKVKKMKVWKENQKRLGEKHERHVSTD